MVYWRSLLRLQRSAGFALAPHAAYLRGRDAGVNALLVSTLESSRATMTLGGQTVKIEQQSGFPRSGESVLTLRMAKPAKFALRVRTPAWASPMVLKVKDAAATLHDGWATVPAREWKDGDRITLKFTLDARFVIGSGNNEGKAVVTWGPFVLACDQTHNKEQLPVFGRAVALVDGQPPLTLKTDDPLTFEAKVAVGKGGVALHRNPDPICRCRRRRAFPNLVFWSRRVGQAARFSCMGC